MASALIQHVQQRFLRKHPEIKPGYTVLVHQKIKEGSKERVQIFEGLVIKVSAGTGVDKTFTVRRVVSSIGVEKIFPFHSGTIVKIEVKKKAKVRRAKLYYMRELFGKSARLKEEQVNIVGTMELMHQEAPEAEMPEEAVVAEMPEVGAETMTAANESDSSEVAAEPQPQEEAATAPTEPEEKATTESDEQPEA